VSLLSQWRVGAMGATGLDYAVLPVVFDLVDVPKADRSSVFADIRVMEDAALEYMRLMQKAGK
jgi:hypothetical protein